MLGQSPSVVAVARNVVWLVAAGLGLGTACAPSSPTASDAATTGTNARAILGGSADTTHDGVMALLQLETSTTAYGCSGTTIAQAGTAAFLLTAAHCVVAHDATGANVLPLRVADPSVMAVVPGPDWQTSYAEGRTFSVSAISIAPGYDGDSESPNDVAVVRYVAFMPSLPVIPILEAADDALAVGSTVRLVGYGVTETGAQNSVRRTVDRSIDSLTPQHLLYLQNDMKGQCHGDSGGPALTEGAGGERVAGVIAYDESIPSLNIMCTLRGAAVRVSSQAAFIHSVIEAASPPDAGGAVDAGQDALGTDGAADAAAADASGGDASSMDGAIPPACGKVTDSRPACAACLESRCCVEAAVCGADPLCLGCGTKPQSTCAYYPPSATLTACLGTCAGNPCGVPLDAGAVSGDAASSDGRAPDASSSDAALGTDAAPTDAALDGPLTDAGGEERSPVDAAPPADAEPTHDASPPDASAQDASGQDAGSNDARPGDDRAMRDAANGSPSGAGCRCDAGGGTLSLPGGGGWIVALLATRWRSRRSRAHAQGLARIV